MSKKQRKPKVNPNKATPPDVVHLPANDNPDSVIISYDQGSSDLLQAATDPAAALRDTYQDIPMQTEEETVAAILTDVEYSVVQDEMAAQDTADRPRLAAILSTPIRSPETDFANMSYAFISEGGERLLETIKEQGGNVANFFHRKKLQLIAHGNDFTDYVKKMGNQVWAAHDKAASTLSRWRTDYEAEKVAKYNAALLKPLDQLTSGLMMEVRRLSKRITDLEDQVRRSVKAQNNTVTKLGQSIVRANAVDTTLVNNFAAALLKGHKAKALSLYIALTGVDVATAKQSIDAMGTA